MVKHLSMLVGKQNHLAENLFKQFDAITTSSDDNLSTPSSDLHLRKLIFDFFQERIVRTKKNNRFNTLNIDCFFCAQHTVGYAL